MAMMKFGIGQAVTRKEDDPILRGSRPLRRRSRAGRRPARGGAALAARACALPHHGCGGRARHAGRPARADRRGHRRSRRRCRARWRCPGVEIKVPPLSDPRARRGAPRRRCDRLRGRRDDRAGARCGRSDRDRVGAAAARGRCRGGVEPGCAAGLAGPARQSSRSRPRSATRRRRRPHSRRRRARCRSRSSTSASSPIISTPAASSPSTMRRRDRITLTLSSQGSHAVRDVLCDDAENRARQAARDHAGRRRRLRHQAVHLSRIRARGRGRARSGSASR